MRQAEQQKESSSRRATAGRWLFVLLFCCFVAVAEGAYAQIVLPAGGVINTLAGTTQGYAGDGGAATSAKMYQPYGTAVDSAGNLYIADTYNSRIRKVTASTGNISTVAGSATLGYSGDGGPATSAELSYPHGVAVDGSGNLYIADTQNNRIRMVTASTGIISTVAGNGTVGYSGDGGAATSAELTYPNGVAVDSVGNIYIADTQNNRIREVTASTGNISTVAGNGTFGYSGDGGAATSAELTYPDGVAVDGSANIYIADFDNCRIRKVTASTGIISTVAGNGTGGYSGNGGAATSAELYAPDGVAVDSAGNIYVADTGNNVIRKVTASTGIISTVAGNGTYGYSGDGGAADSATLKGPSGVAVDSAGNLYIADASNRIRAVGHPTPLVLSAATIINTIAGTGTGGYSGDGGLASGPMNTGARLDQPHGVAVDSAGNLYIADYANNVIRKVTASTGIISTVAGNGTAGFAGDGGLATSAELDLPYGVAVDSAGNLYIADTQNNRIRELTASTGIISTVAGNGTAGYSGDGGLATSAGLDLLEGVAVDSAFNIYISDSTNNRIRMVTASTGIISTVAGNGIQGFSGDGGAATSAKLSHPVGVGIDSADNIYIADYNNQRIRKVAVSTGIISTVAGTGTGGYNGDGIPATSATLFHPQGVAIDSAFNFYIADSDNQRVREVTFSTGLISTVAGNGTRGYNGDGIAAQSAELDLSEGVALDSAGNIYIGDTWNNRIRLVGPTGTPTLSVATSGTPSSYGAGVTFTASTSSGITGAVTFNDGGTPIGTGTIGGTTATFTTSALAVGTHPITASYSENSLQSIVISSVITQTVNMASPTVSVAAAANPSVNGSSVTFTATVTPSIATGTVTFLDGSTSLGTGTLSGGIATYSTSALAVGTHSITATYGGDANDSSSTSSALTQVVDSVLQVVTTSLPAGTAGTFYSATLTATGGTTPYTWSISSGSLPSGLSLNASTGSITGTPTVGGTSNFTVQVTDAYSFTATQPLSIAVTVPQNSFVATSGQMQASRYGQTATQLTTGQVLVAGGMSTSGVVNSAELYTPASQTFAVATTMNVARWLHTATLLNDGTVLVAGGSDLTDEETLDTAEIYNPAAGTFTLLSNTLNTARVGHTATLLNNGQVLIVGGYDPDYGLISDAELYDPPTQTFIDLGDTNAPRYKHAATMLQNGQVLIAGGETDPTPSGAFNTAELYDPVTQFFTSVPVPMTTAREGQAAALLNSGQVLITGGDNPPAGSLNSAEIYDPTANTFTAVTSTMTVPRISHLATLLNGGKVLITGGATDSNGASTALNSAEVYDPTSQTFTATANTMTSAREYQTASLLSDGTVLVAGGTDGTNIFNTAELYMPSQLSGLASIAVTPANPSIGLGAQQLFSAVGTFNDGSTASLASVLWSSSNTTVAAISNDATDSGAAASLTQGAATVTASAAGISGSTTLNVMAPALVSVQLNPPNPTILLGATQQFTAIGVYTDGSTQDLTSSVTWSSSATVVATINSIGVAAGLFQGVTTIQASYGSISSNTNASVSPSSCGGNPNAQTGSPDCGSPPGGGGGTTPTISVATSGTPSAYGNPVTFTATVTSGDTGTVTFYNGSTLIGTVRPSSGAATLTTSSLPAGSDSITASIAASGSYLAATSSAITQVVNGISPTISLVTHGDNPSTYETSVTLSATVTNGGPGAVTFYNGVTYIGTATPSNGTATLSTNTLPVGSDSITATIAANGEYAPATSNAVLQVVTSAPPTISGLSPSSGAVGVSVTVSGTDFGPFQGTSKVTFKGIAASSSSWSNTSIVAVVPTRATSGDVVVAVSGLASDGVEFTLLTGSPVIASVSPSSGNAGLAVTILGSNFGSAENQGTVQFNGTGAGVLNWSDSSITAVVPATTTGPVVVTLANRQSSNSNVSFTVTSSSCN